MTLFVYPVLRVVQNTAWGCLHLLFLLIVLPPHGFQDLQFASLGEPKATLVQLYLHEGAELLLSAVPLERYLPV